MRIFRIADGRHPVWDGGGAALVGGRWNSPGNPVIYASLSYACALLEVLVHANTGRLPKHHQWVCADVPDGMRVEQPSLQELPKGWDSDYLTQARNFGDQWLKDKRSAILLVPSIVSRLDLNALVNPLHPEANNLTISLPEPVIWDSRLFRHDDETKKSSSLATRNPG